MYKKSKDSSKLISWRTYLKSTPQKYMVEDFIGSKMVVEPTLKANGFIISSCNEYDPDEAKPKQVAIDLLKEVNFTEAVYYPSRSRDGHTYWVTIGYK